MTKNESKTPRKLRLNKETLRTLTPTELKHVNGGLPTAPTTTSRAISELTSNCCNSGQVNCNSLMC